jgi:hypothetical protein
MMNESKPLRLRHTHIEVRMRVQLCCYRRSGPCCTHAALLATIHTDDPLLPSAPVPPPPHAWSAHPSSLHAHLHSHLQGITAAKLYSADVTLVDINPRARRFSRANLLLNNIAYDRGRVRLGNLYEALNGTSQSILVSIIIYNWIPVHISLESV